MLGTPVQALEGSGSTVLEATDAAQFAGLFDAVVHAIGEVLVGKPDAIRLSLICLLSEGHLLLEDVPGTGKTTLAKALAATMRGSTSRIQFTPDLLPSDVTGVTIYDQSVGAFEFHPGPVFASIVLADEINRASPKTQSALLEVMEESAVTVDGVTRPVGSPFMVIGTQNPIEQAGTYRLPEAQLDRFLIRTSVGHPDEEAAVAILAAVGTRADRPTVRPMLTPAEVGDLVDQASRVYVDTSILRYITEVVAATRTAEGVTLGASQRGAIALLRAAKTLAATRTAEGVTLGASQRGAIALLRAAKTLAASRGRHFVVPDDVKALAEPVLAHRISIDPEAEYRGLTAAGVVSGVLESVPPPRGAA